MIYQELKERIYFLIGSGDRLKGLNGLIKECEQARLDPACRGFFGIPFAVLIPELENMRKDVALNRKIVEFIESTRIRCRVCKEPVQRGKRVDEKRPGDLCLKCAVDFQSIEGKIVKAVI